MVKKYHNRPQRPVKFQDSTREQYNNNVVGFG